MVVTMIVSNPVIYLLLLVAFHLVLRLFVISFCLDHMWCFSVGLLVPIRYLFVRPQPPGLHILVVTSTGVTNSDQV